MKKRVICLVITSRGNYAKVWSIIKHISEQPNLELRIIVGGSAILPKYGNVLSSLGALRDKIDRTIHFVVEGENPETMAKSAGLAVIDFTTAFENLKPDTVVVIADRFECLPIAIAASYMNITVAHIEGGEVSGSIDESVRHAITKLSHLHFPATKKAAMRIRRLGEEPRFIFPVGATSLDVIKNLNLRDVEPVVTFQKKYGVGPLIDLQKRYVLVIQHPVTTEYEENLYHINETIKAIESLRLNTMWIWPNMDAGADGVSKGIRIFRENYNPSYVHFLKSVPIEYFGPLLYNAACIIGNSSSGIREAGFLGVPCVNIGSRQHGRERGKNVIDVDYDCKSIVTAIRKQLTVGRYPRSYIYGRGNAGKKIVKMLATYERPIQKQMTY